MKAFITAMASLFSLIVIAGVAAVCVLFLAGPHSDILPSWLQVVVIILGWIAVIGVPIAVGAFTWRRLHQTSVIQQGPPGDGPRSAGS